MSVTQSAHSLGSFSLVLTDQTPDEVWNAIGYFGHVAIFDGPADVVAIGDAGLRTARYVGVLRGKGKPSGSRSINGSGMLFWLGDEDNKGDVIETKLSFSNASLNAVIDAVLPDAVTKGVVHDPGGTYTGTHQWQSPRQVLDIVCDAFGIEYRVNGDATVDFGTQAQLYRTLPGTNPAPLVVRRSPGEDTDVQAIGTDFDTDSSVVDYSTRIVLLGQTTDAAQFATGSVNAPVVPYRDLKGNPVKLTRLISESDQTTGSVQARAQLQLNRYNRITRSLDVNPTDYEMVGAFSPGDDAFVFDEESGITNAAYEVTYHGEVLHPDIIRVTEMTWSVAEGMTVGFRDQTGIWYDLTPFVTYETAPPQLIVGDLPYSLSQPGDDAFTIRTDASAGQTPADTTIPGVPGNLVLSTSSILDTSGRTVAVIDATWNVPLNVDGSVITDLDYYVLRYRPTGRANWLVSYSASTSIEVTAIPDLAYEAQIAAVDTSGHQGAWSASSNIHTSKDAIAPPAPADPLVGSYLGQLRITYIGTPAGGGVMPSDTDRIRVEVAAAAAGPFSFVDDLNPFIRGITYTDTPYGVLRYVRLSAIDRDGNVSPYSAVVSGTTVQVADGDVASMSIGKLTAGTLLVDLVNAGRLMSGTTGQRYEINAAAIQLWNASNVKTVDLNGAANLLVGTLQTDFAPNRRIVSGSTAMRGTIQLIAPDGTTAYFESTALTGGAEGVSVRLPLTGASPDFWNTFRIDSTGLAFLDAKYTHFAFGGVSGGGGDFSVAFATTRGDTSGAVPVLATRLFIDEGNFIVYDTDGDARFAITPTAVNVYDPSGTITRVSIGGTEIGFRVGQAGTQQLIAFDDEPADTSSSIGMANTSGVGGRIYARTPSGTPTRFEFTNIVRTGYIPLMASAFNVSSSEAGKSGIRPMERGALDKVRALKIKRYRRKYDKKLGPEEIGLIAEEAPEDVAVDGEAVNLYSLISLVAAAVQELGEGKP